MAPYSGHAPSLGDFCWFGCSLVSTSFSGSTLFFTGLFQTDVAASDGYALQYTIFNVQNPDVLSTSSFEMTIYQGATIYYPTLSGSTGNSPSFSPSNMPYTTHIATSTIWATTILTITLTPNTLIDTLQFNFPSIWINETVSLNALFNAPVCTSTSNPTLTCSEIGLALQVDNLEYNTPNQPIDVSIHSIYNPTSIVGIGSIATKGLLSGSEVT